MFNLGMVQKIIVGSATYWVQPSAYQVQHSIIERNEFQTKQNKALHNSTACAIHASVLRFPGAHGLLTSEIRD